MAPIHAAERRWNRPPSAAAAPQAAARKGGGRDTVLSSAAIGGGEEKPWGGILKGGIVSCQEIWLATGMLNCFQKVAIG